MLPSAASQTPAFTARPCRISAARRRSVPGRSTLTIDSSEALIAGISERDRQEFAERLEASAGAPDFMQALHALGEQYFLDDAAKDHRMSIDIGWKRRATPRGRDLPPVLIAMIVDSFETLFHARPAGGMHCARARHPHASRSRPSWSCADGMF